MGDQNTVINEAELRHILKRTTFGPTEKELKKAIRKIQRQMTRGGAADYVIGLKRKTLKIKGRELEDIQNKWMKYLLMGRTPLLDKLVLFWHDHFAVTASEINWPKATTIHLKNHYIYALGNFKEYVKAINKDPAMMKFLNTDLNNKASPNENYARELCELFTLGTNDLNGVENYTQADIVQIARAFTGWRFNYDKVQPYFNIWQHDFEADFPERGPKVLFENDHGFPPEGASFTTSGEGENEIDTVIDIIFNHLDSDGQNTVARRTAYRLLEYLAYAKPEKTVVDEVVADSGFAGSWDIKALIRAIMVHDAFYETAEPAPFTSTTKKSVKWPIDYVVGTMRITGMKVKGKDLLLNGGEYMTLLDHITNMGQIICEPPSVFGWDWEAGWMSSSTLLARYNFARDIINAREKGKYRFRPDRFVKKKLTDPGEIVDAVTDALGVIDQYTVTERDELIGYLTDNGTNPMLNLRDKDVLNTKLHGLFALIMQSPAYQLH